MTIRKKALGLTAVAVAAALALTACSATGGKRPQTSAAEARGRARQRRRRRRRGCRHPRYTIAMITHEAPGDTFWDKIRAGAEAAAAKDNIDLKYSNDPTRSGRGHPGPERGGQQGRRHRGHAVDAGRADGLDQQPRPTPASRSSAFNAGIEQYKELGALMYFGSDEDLAGKAVGERIAELGAKHPLCVIQEQGSVALEARCAGVAAKAPGTENLQVERRGHPVGDLDHRRQAAAGPVDRLRRHPGRADRAWPQSQSQSPTPAARPRSSPST